jgi:hypothetical protein
MNKKEATSGRQQATGRQAKKKKHADDTYLKRFSQIRKKTCGHLFISASSERLLYPSVRGTKQSSVSCFWIAAFLAMTKPVNPDSDRKRLKDLQDKMKRINRHLAMSRMGLNMYNPLQAERSWGYKITLTLSELRSSSICYHINHLNQINHSSDKRGEGTKGRIGEGNKLQTEICSLVYSSTYSLNLIDN